HLLAPAGLRAQHARPRDGALLRRLPGLDADRRPALGLALPGARPARRAGDGRARGDRRGALRPDRVRPRRPHPRRRRAAPRLVHGLVASARAPPQESARLEFSGPSLRGRGAPSAGADWDEVRQAWNLVADQQPAAVALVESADDVSMAIKFATENDLKVAGQGTGHGAVALGSLEDTILIKTSRMKDIELGDGTARVEAGGGAPGMRAQGPRQGVW